MSAIYVSPAYGRSYANKDDAVDDWLDGKDFKIIEGPYCSIRDFNILDTVVVVTKNTTHILQYGATI